MSDLGKAGEVGLLDLFAEQKSQIGLLARFQPLAGALGVN
jgi:hypothetical protein